MPQGKVTELERSFMPIDKQLGAGLLSPEI